MICVLREVSNTCWHSCHRISHRSFLALSTSSALARIKGDIDRAMPTPRLWRSQANCLTGLRNFVAPSRLCGRSASPGDGTIREDLVHA